MDARERSLIAGEYVLGTLDAAQRREIDGAADPAMQRDIHGWERQFAALALTLPPIAPRPVVWLGLMHAIEPGRRARAPARAPALRLLQAWAALATAASLVLGFGLYRELRAPLPTPAIVAEPVAATTLVAAIDVPKVGVPWTVAIVPSRNEITLHTTGLADPARDGDAELWLIADGKPVSLGLFPKEAVSVRRTLPRELTFTAGATLAVSLEPRGGSTTGAPTGPVITTATLLRAG
jgi:anti-sigma-K factor RskA